MRVVINAYSARLGGGQTYLKNLLAHLPDSEIDIMVFAPAELSLPQDPRVRRVDAAWPTTNPLARAVWERFMLPAFLRRVRADILFCPGGVVATTPPPGCKVVTMFRNMIPFDPALVEKMPWGPQRLRNLILRRVLLRSMVNADLTIFISDHARALIERFATIPNPTTIAHGISEAFRHSEANVSRAEKAPDGDYLLYVSRFDIYKHHREVVHAFHSLPQHLSEGVKLVLIGETNMPEAEHVRDLIEKFGLVDKVLMLGAVPYETLPSWYACARAVLFASSCENCPNILLEAMAAGCPVLSSNVMPMPEFGGDGLAYFSPQDPSDISRALARVLGDADYSSQVGKAALSRSQRYSWAVTAAQTWAQLRALHTDASAHEKINGLNNAGASGMLLK